MRMKVKRSIYWITCPRMSPMILSGNNSNQGLTAPDNPEYKSYDFILKKEWVNG
jgi:hypothetical protein